MNILLGYKILLNFTWNTKKFHNCRHANLHEAKFLSGLDIHKMVFHKYLSTYKERALVYLQHKNNWRVVDSFQFSSLKNLPENLCQSEKFVWNRKLIFTPSGYIFLHGTHFRLVSASSDIRILLTSDALELIAFSRIWDRGCEPGELLINYSVEFVYRKTLRFQFRIEEVKECPLESRVQKDLLV